VERLATRINSFREQNKTLELDEEFRRVAIQVIGQARLNDQSRLLLLKKDYQTHRQY
jgi:hypothetical protein